MKHKMEDGLLRWAERVGEELGRRLAKHHTTRAAQRAVDMRAEAVDLAWVLRKEGLNARIIAHGTQIRITLSKPEQARELLERLR